MRNRSKRFEKLHKRRAKRSPNSVLLLMPRNAAVENTFVQFYPEQRHVAKAKGTLKKVPAQF